MARILSNAALPIMVNNDIVSCSISSSLRLHFGIGLPVNKHVVLDNLLLPVNDELVWDNGTPYPKPYIDRIADMVRKVIEDCSSSIRVRINGLVISIASLTASVGIRAAFAVGEELRSGIPWNQWKRNRQLSFNCRRMREVETHEISGG